MDIIKTKRDLRDAIGVFRKDGKKIALVPTMGALHQGHLSLINVAKHNADIVIASIFVNPLQFGENEDFDKYPRTEEEDIEKLSGAGTNVVYAPFMEEMYNENSSTKVIVTKNTDILCGISRPSHFDGVTTVVFKLFMQVAPDVSVFGEKDYQQLHIIKNMVNDLDIPVKIIGAPIIREKDGLAMSSRNQYLSEEQRRTATEIYSSLVSLRSRIKLGEKISEVVEQEKNNLLEKGFSKIDYLEVRGSDTLELITNNGQQTTSNKQRIFIAAWLGNTRLIDNMEIT